MTGVVEFVEAFDDLASDTELPREDAEAIATALQNWGGREHELVIRVPDWLAEKKDFSGIRVEGSPRVISGICDHETEKAWCIKRKHTGDSDVWIPKNVGRAFRRAGWARKITVPSARGESQ